LKKVVLAILMAFTLFACSDKDDGQHTICGVMDPTEELEWLKTEITIRRRDVSENAKFYYIAQADYENETVFLYLDCDPKADIAPEVRNCEGELLGSIGKEFAQEEFKNSKNIFVPIGFECQLE